MLSNCDEVNALFLGQIASAEDSRVIRVGLEASSVIDSVQN